ncbi:MAG: hypothetical protein VYE77_11465, partial [Planctomycetota bacterium]|nr:hypothetical protein [Planctomycetota bacterium]
MVTAHAEQHSRRAGPGAAAPSRSATFRRGLRVWAAGWLSLLGSLPGQTAEVQERVADLEFVLTTIARGHPDPVGSYGEAVWASHEASLRFRLAHLDDAQFAVELQKLVALLGDADSQLRPLEGAAERLPVEFGWFPDGCFIVGARRGFTDRLGGELVAVEGRPVAAVLQALAPLLSADNPHAARGLAVGQLSRPALLYDAGLADRGDRLRLRVSGPKADGADWTAQAMPPDEAGGAAWTRLSRPSPGAGSGGRAGAWGRVQPDLAYLDLGRATPDPREFEEVLRTWAEDAEVERLAVDLRGVLAGPVLTPEGFAADEWVERLRNSRWNRSASLFVLTSMRMHPGAMAVAVGLDDQTQALFVGGPTGSRPTGRVDVEDRRLPHSPYLLRCATDTAGGGRGADPRRWIEPDLSAPLTFADVQAGRDPALAAIAAFSRGQGAAKQGAASRLRAGHAALPRSRRPSQAPAIGARIEQVPAAPGTAVAPEVRAPGRETYLGRTIAQTMHWRGAEWLMRRTREDEEHSTRMLDALGLQPGLTVGDMGCGNGYHTLR